MLLLCSLSCVATCPIINPLLCFFALQPVCCHLSIKKPFFMLLCWLLTSVHVSCPFVYVHPVPFCFFPFLLSIFFPFLLFAFPVLTPFTISLICACFLNFWFVLHLLIFFGYVFIVSLPFFGFLWTEVLKTCMSFAWFWFTLLLFMPFCSFWCLQLFLFCFFYTFACMCSFWPLCSFAYMC